MESEIQMEEPTDFVAPNKDYMVLPMFTVTPITKTLTTILSQFPENPTILGNVRALLYWNHNPLFTIGPDWDYYLWLNFVSAIMFFAFWFLVQPQCEPVPKVIGLLLYLSHVLSYFLVFIINPGVPDLNLLRDNPPPSTIDKEHCFVCINTKTIGMNVAQGADWLSKKENEQFTAMIVGFA